MVGAEFADRPKSSNARTGGSRAYSEQELADASRARPSKKKPSSKKRPTVRDFYVLSKDPPRHRYRRPIIDGRHSLDRHRAGCNSSSKAEFTPPSLLCGLGAVTTLSMAAEPDSKYDAFVNLIGGLRCRRHIQISGGRRWRLNLKELKDDHGR